MTDTALPTRLTQRVQEWREQADRVPEHAVGLSWAHGVRLTLRSSADKLEADLAAAPPQEQKPDLSALRSAYASVRQAKTHQAIERVLEEVRRLCGEQP